MRISDWSSDVCSSDLDGQGRRDPPDPTEAHDAGTGDRLYQRRRDGRGDPEEYPHPQGAARPARAEEGRPEERSGVRYKPAAPIGRRFFFGPSSFPFASSERSEEHTSELQSLMRISYAVFALEQKQKHK